MTRAEMIERVLDVIRGHRLSMGALVETARVKHGIDADDARSAVAILVDTDRARLTSDLRVVALSPSPE